MSENDEWTFRRDHLWFAVLLLVGVAGTGLLRRYLRVIGLDQYGWLVFVVGYGGMVLLLWHLWIRPLDLTGPSGR